MFVDLRVTEDRSGSESGEVSGCCETPRTIVRTIEKDRIEIREPNRITYDETVDEATVLL